MFAMASILKWFIEENKKEEKEVEELNRQEKENGTWGRYER